MRDIKKFLDIRLTDEFKQKYRIDVNEIGRRMYDKQQPKRPYQPNRRPYVDRKGPIAPRRLRANKIERENDDVRDLDHFVYRCCMAYDKDTDIDDAHLHLDEDDNIQLKE